MAQPKGTWIATAVAVVALLALATCAWLRVQRAPVERAAQGPTERPIDAAAAAPEAKTDDPSRPILSGAGGTRRTSGPR